MSDLTSTLAAWRAVTEPLTPQRLQFARDLADPDWSLSVPEPAKAVIRDLLPPADAMPRLLAFVEAVLAMHQMDWSCGNPRHTNQEVSCPDCGVFCRSCGENWPCPTAALAEPGGQVGEAWCEHYAPGAECAVCRPAPAVPDNIVVDPETFAAMSDPAPDDAPALSQVARAREAVPDSAGLREQVRQALRAAGIASRWIGERARGRDWYDGVLVDLDEDDQMAALVDAVLAVVSPTVSAEQAWREGFDLGTAHGIAYQAGNDEAWSPPPNPYRAVVRSGERGGEA